MHSILVYAGQVSEEVALVNVLKEAHESFRASRNKQIEERKKRNIPLDDDTNWEFVDGLKQLILKEESSAALCQLGRDLIEATIGNEMKPIDEFKLPESLKDLNISLRFKMISQADRRVFQAELNQVLEARKDALRAGDSVKAARLYNEFEKISFKLIEQTIESISGVEGIENFKTDSEEKRDQLIDALDASGLAVHLYTACNFFLELPRKKALRCGVQAQ